jgi:hypothetical protein
MNSKFWLRVAAIALGAVLMAVPVFAQTTATTGAIEGKITDVNGQPIAGVKVTASGARAPISITTTAQGTFLFANLPPGEYEIRVEKQGFGTVVQKDILVSVTQRRVVPFVLTAGQIEAVTVTAEAPLVDPKTTTIGGTFTVDKYVNFIPVGRNFSQTFALAPGVESGGGTGQGNYSISGSSGLENSYLVDGVNITNGGYGGLGTYSAVYGSLGSGVTYDFLEEIQVKSGAIDAEFGQATGGVVNTIVKSGTNNITGAVGVFMQPKGMTSGYKQVDYLVAAVNQQSNASTDIGLSIGGPIVKDKLFYFVAYNPVSTTQGFQVENQALPAGFAEGRTAFATAGQTLERDRSSNNYAAKLTWYLNPNHRIELTGFGDPSRGSYGPQRQAALAFLDYDQGGGQSRISYGADNYSLKYDGVITPNFFVQAQISRKTGKFEETLGLNQPTLSDQRELRCTLGLTPASQCGASNGTGTVWLWGGAGFLAPQQDESWQYKAIATWALASHELKFGVDYYDLEFSEAQQYPGSPTNFQVPIDVDEDGNYNSQGNGLIDCATAAPGEDCSQNFLSTAGYLVTGRTVNNFRVTRARFSPLAPPTTSNELNLFVQDTWSIGSRWNLKLGVRATQQEIAGAGEYTIPFQRVALDPAFPGDLTRIPGSTTYTGKTYKFDWAYSPRVGATFDVSGDGRSKLYANVSRYFERIPNDLAIRALSNEIGISNYRYYGYDIQNYTGLNPLNGNPNTAIFFTGLDEEIITEGTKLPYVDEIVMGYQHELSKDLSLEIRGVYREQGRALEDIQLSAVEATQNFYYGLGYGYPFNPFPDYGVEAFSAYVLANPGENTPSTFPKAERKYKAVELILNKRFSENWLFYANYRYSRLRGFYEGLYRNDNGQDDPNITSLYDFPNSPLLSTQFDSGPLNTDKPHVLKLYGSYQWNNGFTAGASVNWAKGTPRTSMLAHPNYQNAGEIPGLDPIYAWWSESDQATLEGLGANVVNCQDGLCLANGPIELEQSDPGVFSGFFLYDFTKVKRGNLGRTPDTLNVDLLVNWVRKLKMGDLQLGVAVLNAFNQQDAITYNDNVERQAGIPDPDYKQVFAYGAPRTVRLNVRWSF